MTEQTENKTSTPDVTFILQNVLGCKWTLHILEEIRNGNCRPGKLSRSADGLTTKVMNERLVKLVRFDILKKVSYPEVPPRVEYELTVFGEKFTRLLDEIQRLQDELD